ncbi:MAG: hypothetical protein LUC48_11715 [Clostridiales bacterium]|nr:hypothetical protein [Clostridiales bacterium]
MRFGLFPLRFIVCNTTEVDIIYDPACRFTETPLVSYPAKLAQFLYRRFQRLGTEAGKEFSLLLSWLTTTARCWSNACYAMGRRGPWGRIS